MAKRSPRSHANDTAATPTEAQQPTPAARPRGRREAAAAAPPDSSAPDASETFAARTEPADTPADLDLGAPAPSEEEIRYRAYLRYVERGGGDGMHFEDWLEAEKELRSGRK
jgi:DUF2934 family protein